MNNLDDQSNHDKDTAPEVDHNSMANQKHEKQKSSIKEFSDQTTGIFQAPKVPKKSFRWLYISMGLILLASLMVLCTEIVLSPGIAVDGDLSLTHSLKPTMPLGMPEDSDTGWQDESDRQRDDDQGEPSAESALGEEQGQGAEEDQPQVSQDQQDEAKPSRDQGSGQDQTQDQVQDQAQATVPEQAKFTEKASQHSLQPTQDDGQGTEPGETLDQMATGNDGEQPKRVGPITPADSSIRLDQLIFGLLGFSLLVVMILPFKEKKPPSNEGQEYLMGVINDLINMLDSKSYDQQWKVGYAIAKLVELRQKLGFAPGAEEGKQDDSDDKDK